MPRYFLRVSAAVLLLLSMSSVATLAVAADATGPVAAGQAAGPAASAATEPTAVNVQMLFANTCGWCHSGAGRTAGKGPKLMGTTLTDAEIVYRIKSGKPGAMPAFGTAFTDEQLKAIVTYIRDLKPDGPAQ